MSDPKAFTPEQRIIVFEQQLELMSQKAQFHLPALPAPAAVTSSRLTPFPSSPCNGSAGRTAEK